MRAESAMMLPTARLLRAPNNAPSPEIGLILPSS